MYNQIQSEFLLQIPLGNFPSVPKNFKGPPLFAPMIISNHIPSLHLFTGKDIFGDDNAWGDNLFSDYLHQQITDSLSCSHTPYIFNWTSAHNFAFNDLTFLMLNASIYNHPITFRPHCRYLGAILCSHSSSCILSDTNTNRRFVKRLKSKENYLLNQMELHYSKIHLNLRLPLIKTFFLAYTEIFGQVLPSSDLSNLDNISLINQCKLTKIFAAHVDPLQFRIFIGIPSPSQRWIVLKLMFLYQLVVDPKRS